MSSKGISTAATATIGAAVGAVTVTVAVAVTGAVTVLYGRWLWHIIVW